MNNLGLVDTTKKLTKNNIYIESSTGSKESANLPVRSNVVRKILFPRLEQTVLQQYFEKKQKP